jgi:hypothetical protein
MKHRDLEGIPGFPAKGLQFRRRRQRIARLARPA